MNEISISQEALDRLVSMIPNAQEETLENLYVQCADEFMAICNRSDVPSRAETVLEQMTIYRYNQLNAEGLASASFSGMSESYMSDYPERLKRAMYRFRKLNMR